MTEGSARTPAKVRVLIYGSCVSRDTFTAMGDRATLVRYVARQSLISAGNSAEAAVPDFPTFASPFQQRMAEEDVEGNALEILHRSAVRTDLLLLDFVDERGGVYELPGGGVVTRTVERMSVRSDNLLGAPTMFGTDEHFERWCEGLDRLVAALRATGLLERTFLLAVPWAEKSVEGEPVRSSFNLDAATANAAYERYYTAASDAGLQVLVPRVGPPLATTGHRWGLAPFHYAESVYADISEQLFDAYAALGRNQGVSATSEADAGPAPTVATEIVNLFQLRASIPEPSHGYAFYLYRGGEMVERVWYGTADHHTFNLPRPGRYRVKGYIRDEYGGVRSAMSQVVVFTGEPQLPRAERAVFAVWGVTRVAAFVADVLATAHEVVAFVDPSGELVGTEFFGRPVVASQPQGATAVVHENYGQVADGQQAFRLEVGADDVVARVLHGLTVTHLYRLSRSAYLAGLQAGASHIKRFIFAKFNSNIPYTATIGEGTRFGYGGIGVVVHRDAVIGSHCVIGQGVTLGGRSGGAGKPVIGDHVYIATGAKCLGGRIGSTVVVGANAVVLDELPDDCVAVGAPARIVSRDMAKYRSYTHGRGD